MILGQGREGNLSGSKGVTIDNFHISDGVMKDGHFSSKTWLSKLKSNSLHEKKRICVCVVFHHFIFFLNSAFLILV